MAKGLTIEQLKAMGAVPVAPAGATMPQAQPTGAMEDIRETGSRIGAGLQRRGGQFGEVLGQASRGEINPLSSGLRFAGTAAGTVVDVATEALMGTGKALLPESAEQAIKQKLETALQSPIGRAGVEAVLDFVEKYEKFSEQHPELAKDIGAVGNIASILPVERVAVGGAKAVGKLGQGMVRAGTGAAKGVGEVVSTVGATVAPATKAAGDIATSVPRSLLTKATDFISSIPKRAEVAAETASKEAAERSVSAPAVREAEKLGIKLRHANLIQNAPEAEKKVFRDMFNQARTFEADRASVPPSEVGGKEFSKRIALGDTLRQSIGEELGAAVKGLVGKEAPARLSVLKRLQGVQGLKGLKIDNKGNLDFSQTSLRTALTQSDRSIINEAFQAIRGTDAEGYHLLRQEIFEVLGGRKRASVPLTETQDKALEAIRQGLADTLESISPKYRDINKRYAQIAEPLKELRRAYSGLEGATQDILDEAGGKLMRRLTNESMGGTKLKNAIKKLDDALTSAGQKPDVNLQRIQDFSNVLDEYFDIVKDTSFAGQVGLGVRGGARGVFDKLMESAMDALQSSEVRKKAIEDLLFDMLPKADAPKGVKTLFHGTKKGGQKFLRPGGFGNQGRGIYLTTDERIARYHALNAQDFVREKELGRMPYRSERLEGDVINMKLKEGTRIKKFDFMPTESQVDKIKNQGFDGIEFPDEIIREDWDTKILGPYPKDAKARTTLLFREGLLE